MEKTETSSKRKFNFFKNIFNTKLDTLIFFVTSKCNSCCIGCFNWKNLNKKGDLTLTEIEKISKSMPLFDHILFSGGEPTMREDLPEICQIFHKNNKIKSVGIPCNGLLPDRIEKVTRQVLIKNPDISVGLHFSLDGLEKTHDYLRGVRGNFKKIQESVKRINILKKEFLRLDVSINTVISNVNYKEIPELVEFVKKMGVDSHTFDIIRGFVKDKIIIESPTIEEVRRINKLRKITKEYYVKKYALSHKVFSNMKEKYLLNTQLRVLENKKWPFACVAGKNTAVLNANGTVGLCELLPPIGGLRKEGYDFKKVWFNKDAQAQREIIKNHKCDCTHFCFLSMSLDHNPKTIFLKMPVNYFFKK